MNQNSHEIFGRRRYREVTGRRQKTCHCEVASDCNYSTSRRKADKR